jgi:DNA-binding NarL/FixJ family response regulator
LAVTLRLMLVDDSHLMRKGLRLLLQTQKDIAIVGEAEDGADAVRLSRTLRPDVILMDVRMAVMDGLSATSSILAEHPNARVVILSAEATDVLCDEAYAAGAVACLEKAAGSAELFAAIRSARAA